MTALADLHRHLDGSLRPATVVDLASQLGLEVPRDLVFHAGMGLTAALERFAFTLSLLQTTGAVERVAREVCDDAAVEGVTTLELRFAPQLHGVGVEAAVDAALRGIDGRAGLVLCGLYGEDPEILDHLVQVGSARAGVVGIDLAGGPAPSHKVGLGDYAGPFRRAAAAGLGRTVHAGEGRPAAEIGVAVERLGAQRIGHGSSLLDEARVVELVVERGVTIEACPTSNVHTGVVDSVESHPLGRWLDLGVSVCVCTDNTLLSVVDAPTELARVARIEGMTHEKLMRLVCHGHAAAFPRRAAAPPHEVR